MLFTEFDQEQYDNNRRKEGYMASYDKGYDAGYKEGYEEGYKEGCVKARNEIAKRMKAKGMSITEISELTDLSKEQVEEK